MNESSVSFRTKHMLPELLLSLRTQSSKLARKSGLLNEQIAIHFREKRCRTDWLFHRQKCQKQISEQVDSLERTDRVLILGSGLFHEIPLKKLSDTFREVVAVDIVHLPPAISLANSLPNVHLLEQDLTNWLYKMEEKPISKAGWLDVQVPQYFQNQHFDLVISANLLSQLHLAPKKIVEALPKKHKISEEDVSTFCQKITDAHLKYLMNFKHSQVLLITDIETHVLDKNNQLMENSKLPYSTPLPAPQKAWNWNVAPLGEISNEYSLQMKVASFILKSKEVV